MISVTKGTKWMKETHQQTNQTVANGKYLKQEATEAENCGRGLIKDWGVWAASYMGREFIDKRSNIVGED